MVNKQEIEKETLKIVTEQMGMPAGDVGMETSREEIGADSLDDIEMIMAIEERFEIEIADLDAERIRTVQDAADVVAAIILKPTIQNKSKGEI